jgi:RNA polymerase sigma-70 factor (ECF subfamily)
VDDTEALLKGLMLLGLDGDARAHSQLLTLLSGRLRIYFAQRMSADAADLEDLVQETLIAVHTRRASYDRALAFTAWAHAIARYKLIDHWRRRKLRATIPIDDLADFLAAESARSDDGLDLTRALGGLPDRQRGLVEAVKLDGQSLRDAGAGIGLSEGAAKVALHRALRTLAKGLGREHR